ncbi:HD domain-containing protein [Halosimplex pelagicum]|uniref:Metal-dependent phosphohydrolase n=1 Tax=Halosimplex pelagicum TaxID=869886 RepID=A0A7D5T5B1_9EURY|nr:HD domain-containing protein [Halosimplex pelagicum]QLH83291.1 metal-dependent phosphohydrolase [Halosimplex pelagicum]
MRADDVPAVHERVADEAREHFDGDDTGHDMAHAWRVYRLGRRLAAAESADFAVVGAAALVHDLHRLRGEGFTHPRETLPEVRAILDAADFPADGREAVCHCVAHHEEYDFAERTDLDHDPTAEERVLRDADNLDALGAVGVGRAFTFGAHHGQGMHDPDREVRDSYDRGDRDNTVVQHAREKLLRLPEAMETDAGRELAAERAAFVETFVDRFEAEWRGDL